MNKYTSKQNFHKTKYPYYLQYTDLSFPVQPFQF